MSGDFLFSRNIRLLVSLLTNQTDETILLFCDGLYDRPCMLL